MEQKVFFLIFFRFAYELIFFLTKLIFKVAVQTFK